MANGPATIARVIAATDSPFPASFDGSTVRFQLALFSMLALTMTGGMISWWMGRELWRGRRDAYPWEPLFAVRVVFFLCAVQAVIRCAPEAGYMITYREGSAEVISAILYAKRWFDAVAILPGLGWMAMVWVFYTPLCSRLIMLSRTDPVVPRVSKSRIKRLGVALVLVFTISALIALGKR
jgi:hypothetical protein